MNIPQNIKKFRILAGLSQEELALKAELTRNYLALIETGKREPSISTLNKISDALQVPTSILLVEVDDNNNSLDKLLLKAYEIASKKFNQN